ncbi:unnamed protein product, partial [Iphiclides podalirius]
MAITCVRGVMQVGTIVRPSVCSAERGQRRDGHRPGFDYLLTPYPMAAAIISHASKRGTSRRLAGYSHRRSGVTSPHTCTEAGKRAMSLSGVHCGFASPNALRPQGPLCGLLAKEKEGSRPPVTFQGWCSSISA